MTVPLSRHRRNSNLIWPGFVDAVTTLLMVLIFVLTIFTVMQSVLRDQIVSKDNELSTLNDQVAALSDALGLERRRAGDLEDEIGELQRTLSQALTEGRRREDVIGGLRADLAAREGELAEAQGRITAFEARVAALLAARDRTQAALRTVTGERDASREEAESLAAQVADLEANREELMSDAEALRLALADARDEMDEQQEAARLAAARREALEALIADLRARGETDASALASAREQISEAEAAHLADAAALAALREKFEQADTELATLTLALEAERQRAEDTLSLLAAARMAEGEASDTADKQAAALAMAREQLTQEQKETLRARQEIELLNRQLAALRGELASLQSVLDDTEERRAAASIEVESLGRRLNAALAQVTVEERRRAELEEAERKRLEAEKADLERFRSEFFGRLSEILAGQDGVRIEGDRFIFPSEVLFPSGSADLSPAGRDQVRSVVTILDDLRPRIPPEIEWIIRVDGHTDTTPISPGAAFRDNWELSSARALSVVWFMQEELGFPPDRLAATGFGEYQPAASGDSDAARAQNRRIELKLTER